MRKKVTKLSQQHNSIYKDFFFFFFNLPNIWGMGKKCTQTKIFSEAPFGSIAEQLARGCLFYISWENTKMPTPMADPNWSQVFTRSSTTQGCYQHVLNRREARRDTATFLPLGSITQLRESRGYSSWNKVLPELGTVAHERSRFSWWCSLPEKKQVDVNNKKSGEEAGSHIASRPPLSPAAWVWTSQSWCAGASWALQLIGDCSSSCLEWEMAVTPLKARCFGADRSSPRGVSESANIIHWIPQKTK